MKTSATGEARNTADDVRQALDSLPPLVSPSRFGPNVMGGIDANTGDGTGAAIGGWAAQVNGAIRFDILRAKVMCLVASASCRARGL